MRKGGPEDEELDTEKKHQTLTLGRLVVAEGGIVVGCPNQDTKEDLPWDLNEDICDKESLPGIGFGRALAYFVTQYGRRLSNSSLGVTALTTGSLVTPMTQTTGSVREPGVTVPRSTEMANTFQSLRRSKCRSHRHRTQRGDALVDDLWWCVHCVRERTVDRERPPAIHVRISHVRHVSSL